MKHSKIAARLLRTTILTGAIAAVAAPALAQDDDDDVIIITGSRLDQANLNSSSPVFQVDAGEIDSRGVTRVEDLLNILPQTFAGQTSNLANGASGTSTLNLRGLGATRTLTLVDGKRLSYGAGNAAAVNLDQIPAQLIERVDIVTGGASAVYGSDALAGVANFILKRDFEGLELDGQVGFFQDGNGNDFASDLLTANNIPVPGATADGRSVNVSAIFGANTPDGRGNVTAFLQYQDQNEVRQDARDFSACAFGTSSAATSVGGVGCVGSSTFRRFFTPGGDFFLGEDSVLVPFTNAPEQTFNFAPDNFLQRNNERFNFQALARYNITENIEAFLDLAFTENQTDSQIAFSGTFFRPFQVNCGNPLIQTPVDAAAGGGTLADALGCDAAAIAADTDVGLTAGYRNVTGDPRSSFIGVNTFRMVGGFRGNLNENFEFETFGQFSRTRQNTVSTGDLSFADVQDGLFAVDDGSGNVVCRSGNAGCLPFNIFEFNGVSAEAAQFAQGTGLVTSEVEQIV
ncbi:MAG: TonB-dependent receptor plug domain-containing protein, partial [Pseudomonadota bacterium]